MIQYKEANPDVSNLNSSYFNIDTLNTFPFTQLVEKYANIAETMLKNFPFYAVEMPNEEIVDTRFEFILFDYSLCLKILYYCKWSSIQSEAVAPQVFEYQWSGVMLSSYLKLLLNANRVNKAWSAFETYLSNQNKVMGELSENVVKNIFDAFYNEQQIERAYVSVRIIFLF